MFHHHNLGPGVKRFKSFMKLICTCFASSRTRRHHYQLEESTFNISMPFNTHEGPCCAFLLYAFAKSAFPSHDYEHQDSSTVLKLFQGYQKAFRFKVGGTLQELELASYRWRASIQLTSRLTTMPQATQESNMLSTLKPCMRIIRGPSSFNHCLSATLKAYHKP